MASAGFWSPKKLGIKAAEAPNSLFPGFREGENQGANMKKSASKVYFYCDSTVNLLFFVTRYCPAE